MNKTKYLIIAVIVLLIINLIFVFFFFINPKHGREEKAKKIIIEKLKFDDEQVKQYQVLIDEHISEITKTDSNIKILKNELYKTLINNDTLKKDTIMDEIILNKKKIENINYQHFLQIKKICRPEQIQYFNDLTSELASFFNPHPKK